MRAPENWRAHGVRERAISEPLLPRNVDSIASLRSVSKTLCNDAIESTFRGRGGSRIARLRASRAGHVSVRA
eukprot:8737175-Lingulodinium_polyedra.AAC.1